MTVNQNEKHDYTSLQIRFIEKIRNVINYGTLEANLSDNCSPVTDKDVASWLGISPKQAQGLLASCYNRELLTCETVTRPAWKNVKGAKRLVVVADPLYMVSEKGIREYFRLFVADGKTITRPVSEPEAPKNAPALPSDKADLATLLTLLEIVKVMDGASIGFPVSSDSTVPSGAVWLEKRGLIEIGDLGNPWFIKVTPLNYNADAIKKLIRGVVRALHA